MWLYVMLLLTMSVSLIVLFLLIKMQSDKGFCFWLKLFEEEFKKKVTFSAMVSGLEPHGSVCRIELHNQKMADEKHANLTSSMVDETNTSFKYGITQVSHLLNIMTLLGGLKEDDTVIQSGIIDLPDRAVAEKRIRVPIVMPTIKKAGATNMGLNSPLCIKGNELWARKVI